MKSKVHNGLYLQSEAQDDDASIPERRKMEGSPSAGVMICRRPGIDIAPIDNVGGKTDNVRNPYEVVPSHATLMMVNCWVKSRFLVGSVYMDVKDKLGSNSRAIMFVVGLALAYHGLPYIMVGDYNRTLLEMAESGWMNTIDGYVCAPDLQTCKTAKSQGSTIDYGIVFNEIAPTVESVWTYEDDPFQPHRYVGIRLTMRPVATKENTIDRAARLPVERPIGPTTEYCQACDNEIEHSVGLDERGDWLIDNVERELVHVYHLDSITDHKGTSPYVGGSKGFNLKRTAVEDKPRSRRHSSNKIIKSFLVNAQRAQQLVVRLEDQHEYPASIRAL